MKIIRVLFVEDSSADVELLIRHIKKGGFTLQYDITYSLDELTSLINRNQYDICICDFKLPGFSGIDAVKRIEEFQQDIPVILASGTIPDEQAIDAVLAGAKDYVLKDNLRRLIPAMQRELEALEQRREKRKSDRLLAAVFNSSTGVRISNKDRIIIKVNKAYCEMMGYTSEELVGSNIDDIIPKERREQDRIEYDNFIKNFLENGVDTPGTKKDVRKDGTYIDVMVRSNVFVENEEIFVVSTLQDVSEVFKYKTLFEESGRIAKLGGWERDVATGKEVWTKQIYEIYEVSEDTFDPATESDDRFHTDESLELMKKSMKAAEEEGIPFDIEVEIVDALGNRKWCRGTGNPIFEKDKVVKLIGSFQDITERKSRELELQRNEEKYKFLFDQSPNSMIIFEVKSDRIIDANTAAISMYGYSKEEFKELAAVDLRPEREVEKYLKISEQGDHDSEEIRSFRGGFHKRKNGEEFIVDVYTRTTVINDKKANIVVINDITEKYDYEQDLIKTNNILNALIDNAPIGLVAVDAEGSVEELWNPKAEEIFGWKRDEVLGKRLPYVPNNKLDEFEENLRKGLVTKRSFITEIERVRKNGEKIYLREFVTPLKNSAGDVSKILMLTEDVTEKKKVELALVGSEQKYRNLVEASHDLVWRIDIEGNFNFINNASSSILGYSPSEMIGNSFIPYINPSKAEETLGVHESVIKGDVFESFPLEMVTADGELRHLSATAYPIVNDNGIITGCSGTATDITYLKNYQSQLEESLAEKEILIKEIHHRVKNNLAVISGLFALQAMHVDKDDDETLTILQESQSRIKSIAAIHEKLYQNHVFSSIEIKSYLTDFVLEISETYDRNDKQIDIEVHGDEVSLNVNQAVPFGILANELIVNAYKYAFKGKDEGEIKVSLNISGDELIFSVADNGVGLAENFDINKLNSLGMTLIRTLAEQLNASFEWNTKRGEGVTFKVIFVPDTLIKATWIKNKPENRVVSRLSKNKV
ncbi:MAG: PAS domain S-box protein [Balneola sp.]